MKNYKISPKHAVKCMMLCFACMFSVLITCFHSTAQTLNISSDLAYFQVQDYTAPFTNFISYPKNLSLTSNNEGKIDNGFAVLTAQIRSSDPDNIICQGEVDTLTASIGRSYLWSTGDTVQTIYVSVSGTYTVVIADSLGGTDSAMVVVTVLSLPVANAGQDIRSYLGVSAQIGCSSIDGSSYIWTPSSGLNDSTISNPNVTIEENVIYRLFVTDSNGCTALDSVSVIVQNPSIPCFANGKANLKIKNSSSVTMDYSNPPQEMAGLILKYHILGINHLFLSNDSTLSRVYTLSFDFANNTTGFADTVLADSLVADLMNISYIEYAEKVFVGHLFYTPNDPLFAASAAYMQLINADEAWDEVLPGNSNASPIIAIIDNSFLSTHEDLSSNVWINLDEYNGSINTDDDGNGVVDDINGWDFGNNDATLFSVTNGFHGSHVAGIAGARTNNALGIASVGDPGAAAGQGFHPRLMFIKSFTDGAFIDANMLAASIEYAVDNGANVINMSLGGPFYTGLPAALQTAVDHAFSHGVLCVAAAGNDGALANRWPCGLNHVMCVGSTTITDEISCTSNFGPNLDVMAPGEDITSCDVDNNIDYRQASGTSMATPMVTGIAALIRNKFPFVSGTAIESCIESTCVKIDNNSQYPVCNYANPNPPYDQTNNQPCNFFANNLGEGRVDALAAINCIESSIGNIGLLPIQPCPLEPSILFYYSDVNIISYNWTISPVPVSINSTTIATPEVIFGNLGSYTITLNAVTDQNTSFYVSDVVSINTLPNATIASLNNLPQTCDGSSQSISVQFSGTPPFGITLTDGLQNYSFTGLVEFQSTLYVDVFEDHNTISVVSVTDRYCFNPNGNEITFSNIVKCCPNLIDNGDFEDHQSSIPADYPNSTSPGIFHFFTDYHFPLSGPNCIGVLQSNPNLAAQHGDFFLGCDGFAADLVTPSPPIQGIDAAVWRSMPIALETNQDYYYSFWITNPWNSASFTETNLNYGPGIRLSINGQQMMFDNLQQPENIYYAPVNPTRWMHLCGVWNSSSNSTLVLELQNAIFSGGGLSGGNGNDFLIDNIEFRCIDDFDIQATADDIPICLGDPSAQLEATATGGSLPYTYSWSPATGLSQTDITNPTANPTVTTTYTITGTDANGCTSSDHVTVIVNTVPIVSNLTQSLCMGESVTLIATGGGTYLWNNSATTSSIIVSPTITTAYSVTVTGINSCTATGDVVLTVNPLPIVDAGPNITMGLCNSVLLGPSGSIPNTSFLWTPATFLSDAHAQQPLASPGATITYTLTETNLLTGCSASDNVTVSYTPNTIQMNSSNVTCFGQSNGSATVIVSGATGPYSYLWSTGGTTASISGLVAGTYTVTITDIIGCTTSSFVFITQPLEFLASITSQSNLSCYGSNNGSATVTPSGGLPPYNYLWSNNVTDYFINDVSAGTYCVTITDANSCTATTCVIITEPTILTASISNSTNAACFGSNDGTATVAVTGGTSPYSYQWSSGGSGDTENSLIAGTYEVTVTDYHECTASTSVTISQPSLLTASISASTNVSCFGGANGSATITASGGSPDYSYFWSNGLTTAMISNQVAGTYSVTVTDSHGCTASTSILISQPTLLTASINSHTNVSCYGGNNGSATVTPSGGTLPYSYNWSNSALTQTINDLIAGTYNVTVTDANACTATASVIITQPTSALTATTTVIANVNCFGGSTGSAKVNPSGGTPVYTYLWSNTATTQTINTLVAGTYTVTVTDSHGCTATASVIIKQPPLPLSTTINQTNENCFGDNNGSATAIPSGGTIPYSYHWSTGVNNATIINLLQGTYSVTITDGLGCTVTSSVIITQPPLLVAAINAYTDNCIPNNDGTATVTASGGTPPYTYTWSSGSLTNQATGLAAGTYNVTVKDAHLCVATTSVIIGNKPIEVASSISYECEKNIGSIDLAVICGEPPYTYAWSNGATTQDIANVNPGIYTVIVNDGTGPHFFTYTLVTPLLAPDLGLYYSSSCGLGLTFPYEIQNPDPNMTYTWSIDPPSAGTALALPPYGVSATITWTLTGTANIVIHATNSVSGCSGDFNFEVNEPCDNPPVGNFYFCNENSLPVLASNSTHTGEIFVVNGSFTINSSNLIFNSCKFFMGPLANIQIANGITTTFNNCFFLSDSTTNSCRHMWDGIYVKNQTSLAVFSGTKIWDAINGLVSKNGGQITQSNDYFNRNFKCMQVMDYTPPSGSNINVTMSKCTLLGVANLPYPPYTGNASYLGMDIKNIGAPNATNGIIVGDVTLFSNRNVFKDLSVAINIDKSNVKVYNNKFTYSLGTAPISYAIIDYGANSAPFPKYNTSIGAITTNYPNLFENYKYGIEARWGQDLSITLNTFTGCTRSIYYSGLGDASSATTYATIYKNTITNGLSLGIGAAGNPNCTSLIYCNNITMMTNNSNNGITITGISKTNASEIYTLNNNVITALNGIKAQNVYRINASSNPITLQNNNTGNPSYGMFIQNCDYQNIDNTTISGVTTTRTSKIGIHIENAGGHPMYSFNTIQDVNRGFNIMGTNTNLSTPWLKLNTLKNDNCGMFKISGYIGDQGGNNAPWFNKWDNVLTHTDGTGTIDRCWSRNIGFEFFNANPIIFTNEQSCIACSPPMNYPLACPRTFTTLGTEQAFSGENTESTQNALISGTSSNIMINDIVSNTIDLDVVLLYLSKQILYAQMQSDKSVFMQDAGFGLFMASCDNNSIGLLYKADNMIGKGNADSASLYNGNVIVTNIADSLHKFVNHHYISYLRNASINSLDMSQLQAIANLCPLEYGDGVYIARGLLNIVDTMFFDYSNSCETSTTPPKSLYGNNIGAVENEAGFQVRLFPNPAKDLLRIEYINDQANGEDVFFEVYDLWGGKLMEFEISANQSKEISTETLAQGVYSYTFRCTDKILKRDKLVIIK